MTGELEPWLALGGCVGGVAALHALVKKLRGPPIRDAPVAGRLAWGNGVLSYPSLEAGLLATGVTGSGKSSAMHVLLLELLRDGCGLYAPAAKPDDLPKLLDLCRRAGRTDVVVVGRGRPARVNFLLESMGGRGFADEALLLNAQLGALGEAINRTGGAKSGGGENNAMFVTNSHRLGRTCFLLMLLAGASPSVERLLEVIQSAAPSPRALVEGTPDRERYLKGECHRLLCLAYDAAKADPALRRDYEQVDAYFTTEFPGTAEKTRSCFVAEIVGPLDVLSKGVVAETLGSAEPTLDLAACLARNAIVLTDYSVGRDREVATAINVGLKLLIQQKVLYRTVAPDAKPFVLFLDEYGQTVTSGDAEYASIQRSNKGPMVCMVQGREFLLKALGGDEAATDTLTGNFSVKVAAGPQTQATADWLCKLLGSRLGFTASGSSTGGYKSAGEILSGSSEASATGGFSQSMLPLLTPFDLALLASGGARHGNTVGIFCHSAGERFAGNQPFVFSEVRQLV